MGQSEVLKIVGAILVIVLVVGFVIGMLGKSKNQAGELQSDTVTKGKTTITSGITDLAG